VGTVSLAIRAWIDRIYHSVYGIIVGLSLFRDTGISR
jgi:hypothetical protein